MYIYICIHIYIYIYTHTIHASYYNNNYYYYYYYYIIITIIILLLIIIVSCARRPFQFPHEVRHLELGAERWGFLRTRGLQRRNQLGLGAILERWSTPSEAEPTQSRSFLRKRNHHNHTSLGALARRREV